MVSTDLVDSEDDFCKTRLNSSSLAACLIVGKFAGRGRRTNGGTSADNLCRTPWKASTFLYVYANEGMQAHMTPIINSHVLQHPLDVFFWDRSIRDLTHMAMLVVKSKYTTFSAVPFLVRKYRATAEQMHAL